MLPGLGKQKGVNVPALLATMAVVGYMATAGLPWWAVVAVVVLTAGLAGRNGLWKTGQNQPAKAERGRPAKTAQGRPVKSPAGMFSTDMFWTDMSRSDMSRSDVPWADNSSAGRSPSGQSTAGKSPSGQTTAGKSPSGMSSAGKCATVVPVSVNVRTSCPDEFAQRVVCGGPEPVFAEQARGKR